MKNFWQDTRFAARMLLKTPGFTIVAVLSLAVGIGANTAIFSVVNSVLLNPLPFTAPERLMVVQEITTGDGYGISYPNFQDLKASNSSFESLGVFNSTHVTLTGEVPARLSGAVVSANLFNVLGVAPIQGRSFLPEEDRYGGGETGRPVILSHSFWRSRYNADPSVVGRTLMLDGLNFIVVGVMPAGFQFPVQNEAVDVWSTVAIDAEPSQYGGTIPTSRGYPHYTGAVARLKSGVTIEQAQAELNSIAANLRAQHTFLNSNFNLRATPVLERFVGDIRPTLLVLFGAVGFVLLIACVNVANLLLTRATTRRKDFAIRAALGASRWRVVRQLLVESVMLACIGGAFGLLIALWGIDLITTFIPAEVPRIAEIAIDARVGLFTMLVSLITGIVFGIVPAWGASKVDLTESLKEGGRGGTSGIRQNRLRSALVITEVALALVLLVGAGLLLQSFLRLQRVEPGFSPRNTLTFTVSLPEATYAQGTVRVTNFYQQLVERTRQLPGVQEVSIAQSLPLSGSDNSTTIEVEGVAAAQGARPSAGLRFIGLNYFQTLSIPISKGRDFDSDDVPQTTEKVIINEAFARLFFADGSSPLGRRITLGYGGKTAKEIVGIVGDVKHESLSLSSKPEMYVPLAQFPVNTLTLLVRTDRNPLALTNSVRQAVQELDAELPVYDIKRLDDYLVQSIAAPRFNAILINLFAFVALLLASVGLYGVIAYSASSRTHEIGIRLALGAQKTDVLRLIFSQGMRLTLLGIFAGALAAWWLTSLLTTMLYEVQTTDPLTFIGVAILLLLVAMLACFIPARRATKVDPIIALRYE